VDHDTILEGNPEKEDPTTNLKSQSLVLQAPNAISVAKKTIGPLSTALKLIEKTTLTILKALQTWPLNTHNL